MRSSEERPAQGALQEDLQAPSGDGPAWVAQAPPAPQAVAMSAQIATANLGADAVGCEPFPGYWQNGHYVCDVTGEWTVRQRRTRFLIAGVAVGVGLVAWIAWLALRRRPSRLQGLARRRRRRR